MRNRRNPFTSSGILFGLLFLLFITGALSAFRFGVWFDREVNDNKIEDYGNQEPVILVEPDEPTFDEILILITQAIISQEQYPKEDLSHWNVDNPTNCSRDVWKEACVWGKVDWEYETGKNDRTMLPKVVWFYSQCHKPRGDCILAVCSIWNGGHKGQCHEEPLLYGDRCVNLVQEWIRTGEWKERIQKWEDKK